MNDPASASLLKKTLRDWFAGVRRCRGRFLLAFAYMGVLVGLCLNLGENYPFSPFPMYGNPKPEDVDYFFLTDAGGNPLSTQDYAGMTAPQIKKRINSSIEALRDSLGGDKKAEATLSEALREILLQLREKKFPEPKSSHPKKIDPALLAAVAKAELAKMREDAAKKTPALIQWPAGVKLKMGLIETTEQGFREQFRTVTELSDAGPPTTGEHVVRPPGSAATGMLDTMRSFGLQHAWLLGGLAVCLAALRLFPPGWRQFALGGSDRWNTGRLEGLCLRAGLAYVMWQSLQVRVEYSSLPKPAGLAWFDLQWLRDAVLWFGTPEHWNSMQSWLLPMLVWYVLGWGAVVPLTVVTFTQIFARSLYASQGAPHHGHQIIGLVFAAQMLVAWAVLAGRLWRWIRKSPAPPAPWLRWGNWSSSWLFAAATIAAAYFITVVTKLDESNGRWIKNAHYFSNQIVKTHRQNFYNDLNPEYLKGVPAVAQESPDPDNDRYRHNIPQQADWMLKHPLQAKVFFTLGFIMEATSLFLILSRSLALLYGVLIIAFHLLVLWLMQLTFPLNVETVLVVCVNLPGWLIFLARRRLLPEPSGAQSTSAA